MFPFPSHSATITDGICDGNKYLPEKGVEAETVDANAFRKKLSSSDGPESGKFLLIPPCDGLD
jgi:hypothetical protein